MHLKVLQVPSLGRLSSQWGIWTSRQIATSIPEMPPCSEKLKPYQGKSHAEIVALRQRHLNPSLSSNLLYKEPLLLTQGYMQWLWDHTGKRYLDMLAGIVTVSVGHCHL